MGDVIDLAKYRGDRQKERLTPQNSVRFLALCLSCFGRWMGAAPLKTNLFMLECPHCRDCDSFVAVLPDDLTISGDPTNAS